MRRATTTHRRTQSLARACGRVHEVVWDDVDGDAPTASRPGITRSSSTPHGGVRQGGLNLVRAETVEGDCLRGTLLRS